MRLRRRLTRALHSLDHATGRTFGRLRVLVDVRMPMNVAVLRPVWRRLLDDSRITLSFTAEDAPAVAATLARDDMSDALVDRRVAEWSRWDLSMTADIWNHAPLRRCRRTINFFHGVAGKYDLDDPARLGSSDLHRFDVVAFINEDRMRRYVDAGAVAPRRAALVGYPKLDALMNGALPAADARRALGLDPALPTTLYAPTFSTAGSLHAAGPAIVTALAALGGNVIVKLHDRSMVPHPMHTAGIDWPSRFALLERNRRIVLARVDDASPCLAAADVLVTDHSTVGFEFAVLDRPIVVYDAPALLDVARIHPEKWALLRSMADIVASTDALQTAVRIALRAPEHRRAARARARALFANPGTATERALDVVYRLLGVAPLRSLAHAGPDATGAVAASDDSAHDSAAVLGARAS